MNACTIIARNYLPHARVLAASFFEHHPQGSFTVLVVDDPGAGETADEPFVLLSPYDIGLERAEVHRMALIYDLKELATAVKPPLLRHLLRDADDVAYFDPDIEVFAPLDDISELARRHGIVLTPHTTAPMPRDDLLPSEAMLLQAGIYNLGFIAVGSGSEPFLDWWAERLARDCIVAVEDGLFVDQRWIDFVPALFDHVVLRDPGCNVAYWNLGHRRITRNGNRYDVDGVPLRFFHYSGFSPDRLHLLSTHMGSIPRILFDDHPEVRHLCDAYARRLRETGFDTNGNTTYRFDRLPNGVRIEGTLRRDVREAIIAAERAGEETAPDPFDPATADAFLEWLRDPIGPAGLPRYLDALYRRRGDLRGEFPNVAGQDRDRYLRWARTTGRSQGVVGEILGDQADDRVAAPVGARARRVEDALRRAARRHRWLSPVAAGYRVTRRTLAKAMRVFTTSPPSRRVVAVPSFPPLPGVNLAGYLRAELGVGEVARRLARSLEDGRIPHSTVTYRRTASRQQHPFPDHDAPAAFDINIVCVNADELPNFHADAGPELFADRYTIGVWFWEVSRFPETLHGSFDLVDEVWVASDFVAEAISAATSKPVRVVPIPVEAPQPHGLTRADVGLPEGFVFLFNFDFLSVLERKNPFGVIEAFEQAFAPGEGPCLVIKTINGHQDEERLERLLARAAARPDVLVLDGYVSATERDALTALCDCYVSLHRSEGFGLTMAEAMAAAKPVIATGYSGNLAFMDESNSLLVPYALNPIPPGQGPYPPGGAWAAPDLDKAAGLMRWAWEERDEAYALGRLAKEDVLRRSSTRRTAKFIATRLSEIRAEWDGRSSITDHELLPGAALLRPGGPWSTRVARKALQRLLWPYLVEQQAFAKAVAAALRTLDAQRLDEPAWAPLDLHEEVEELSRGERRPPAPEPTRASGLR